MPFGRTAMLALAALSAIAGCRVAARADAATFSYPPQAASTATGNPTIASIIYLPSTETSGFRINFVLPADYKRNSPVALDFYLAGPAGCAAFMAPHSVLRYRPGKPTFDGAAGLKAVGGNLVSFGASSKLVKKVFRLKPDAGFPGQRAGDGLNLSVLRDTTRPDDTCIGSIFVTSIAIRYEKAKG